MIARRYIGALILVVSTCLSMADASAQSEQARGTQNTFDR